MHMICFYNVMAGNEFLLDKDRARNYICGCMTLRMSFYLYIPSILHQQNRAKNKYFLSVIMSTEWDNMC